MSESNDIISTAWMAIVAYSMVQGYLLFLVFPSYRDGSNQAKWLLALLSLVCALLLTEELIEGTVGYEKYPHLIFALGPLWYLFGPLIYLYIRLYRQNHQVTWKDSWHMLPALYVAYSTMDFYSAPASYKLEYLRSFVEGYTHPIHNTSFVIFCVQSCFYMVASWRIFRNSKNSRIKKPQNHWLWQLVIALAWITSLSFLSLFALNSGSNIRSWSGTIYILWISMVMLFLFLRTIKSPRILYLLTKLSDSRIGSGQALTQESFQELLQFMTVHEPYKDPHFDIQSLARQMGCSKNYLNRLIKKHTGLCFRDFTNQYRLEYAKQKLSSPYSKQFTIQSIANDSGFASVATFYRIFKKVEGTTPKTFIRN